jgi:hypothetical protein
MQGESTLLPASPKGLDNQVSLPEHPLCHQRTKMLPGGRCKFRVGLATQGNNDLGDTGIVGYLSHQAVVLVETDKVVFELDDDRCAKTGPVGKVDVEIRATTSDGVLNGHALSGEGAPEVPGERIAAPSFGPGGARIPPSDRHEDVVGVEFE